MVLRRGMLVTGVGVLAGLLGAWAISRSLQSLLYGVEATDPLTYGGVTGVLLAIYYKPSPDAAYDSLRYIMNDVPYGWLIRSIHRYAAELMVLTVIIHMFKVFLTASYKSPREMNWTSGAFLLFITLGFGFTGYLLPWDQTAYWASTVGTQMAETVPLIGPYIAVVLKGGTTIGEATLARFYAAHVIVLPWVTFYFLAVHFFMIRRQGCADPL